MASQVEIINRALSHLGETRIASPTDNAAMNALWQTTLEGELRSGNWRFATKRAKLPALSAAPSFGYTSQYQLPSDFIRMVQVGEGPISDAVIDVTIAAESYIATPLPSYVIEGGVLLTNHVAPLPIRYVWRVDDTALFDALFVEALACKLALDAGIAIASMTRGDREDLVRLYRVKRSEARRVGAVESPEWHRKVGPLRRARV